MGRGIAARKKIQAHVEQRQSILDAACKITPSFSAEPKTAGCSGDKIGNAVANLDKLGAMLQADIVELQNVLCEINYVINKIPDKRMQIILERKWCLDKPESYLDAIATKIGYSYKQTQRLYIKGMLVVQRILDQKKKMS